MTRTTNIYFPTGEIEKIIIKNIWRLAENDFHLRKERILPKGTVEIIFNFSDKIHYLNPSTNVSTDLPIVFLNGLNLNPFELIKMGHQCFIGIQLDTIGLKMLSNIPAKETNNCVNDGKYICTDLYTLAEKLYFKQEFHEQVELILMWIKSQLQIQRSNPKNTINRAQRVLSFCCNHEQSVKKVCEEIGLSDRQLRRISNDWFGMNTEELILYNKYLNSLHLLHHTNHSLTEIGYEAGYYDQSHFIREFKSYTDMTPSQYKKSNAEFPGHIFL